MIGIDEVGRGCVGGPLVVVGVYLSSNDLQRLDSNPRRPWIGDSKRLKSPRARINAVQTLLSWLGVERSGAFQPEQRSGVFGHHSRYHVWIATSEEVDDDGNILTTTMRGMNAVLRALLPTVPSDTAVWVDGNIFRPDSDMTQIHVQTLVGGDANNLSISMASMIAKAVRDHCIATIADQLTLYGDVNKHQGYGTATHRAAIETHGWVQGFHRQSFLQKWNVAALPSATIINI